MDYSAAGPRGMGEAVEARPEDGDKKAFSDALNRLSNYSLAQIIQAGHEALLKDLVARVNSGTASHQEKAILRNMLRDNGMTMGVPPAGTGPGQSDPGPALPDLPAYSND